MHFSHIWASTVLPFNFRHVPHRPLTQISLLSCESTIYACSSDTHSLKVDATEIVAVCPQLRSSLENDMRTRSLVGSPEIKFGSPCEAPCTTGLRVLSLRSLRREDANYIVPWEIHCGSTVPARRDSLSADATSGTGQHKVLP